MTVEEKTTPGDPEVDFLDPAPLRRGPPSMYIETNHGLETMPVDAAIEDKDGAAEFTGHSHIVITERLKEGVEFDEYGLIKQPPHGEVEPLDHKLAVISKGVCGPVNKPAQLCKMHK